MVHLVATLVNDTDYVPALVSALERELAIPDPTEGREAWGVGYYAEGRPLIIKKPARVLAERRLSELTRDIQSRVLLACIQAGAHARASAPPYRFRNWLFGVAGSLAPLAPLSDRIVERLPDFVRSEMNEATPGMLAFGMFVAELHRDNVLDDPAADARRLGRILGRTAQTIQGLSTEASDDGVRAAYVATNGRVILAAQSGAPLYHKLQMGLEAPSPEQRESALGDFRRTVEALKRFRALIITGHPPEGSPEWKAVPEGQTLTADAQLHVDFSDPQS